MAEVEAAWDKRVIGEHAGGLGVLYLYESKHTHLLPGLDESQGMYTEQQQSL